MAIPIVEFSREEYKIRKVLAKNQLWSNEIIEFSEWELWQADKNWASF